jgi:hypothetical protein
LTFRSTRVFSLLVCRSIFSFLFCILSTIVDRYLVPFLLVVLSSSLSSYDFPFSIFKLFFTSEICFVINPIRYRINTYSARINQNIHTDHTTVYIIPYSSTSCTRLYKFWCRFYSRVELDYVNVFISTIV